MEVEAEAESWLLVFTERVAPEILRPIVIFVVESGKGRWRW